MKIKAILIGLALAAFVFMAVPKGEAGGGCEQKVVLDVAPSESNYYKACNSEMRTTFEYTTSMTSGHNPILCRVYGTDFYEQYYTQTAPTSPIIQWTHCTNLNNHKASMDVMTGYDVPPLFNTTVFTVEYFASQPTSPPSGP